MNKFLIFSIRVGAFLVLCFFILQTLAFFGVKYELTKVLGEIDDNSAEYNKIAKENAKLIEDNYKLIKNSRNLNTFSTTTKNKFALPKNISIYGPRADENWCKIKVASQYNDFTTNSIFKAYRDSKSEILLNNMLLALELRHPNKDEISYDLLTCQNTTESFVPEDLEELFFEINDKNLYSWQNGEPWQIISKAIKKDKDLIYKTSELSGVQPRLLVSVAIVEQLRLYYTQRELFEKVFKPLEILANANKMAWGIMAIKERMAIETEDHLHDINSDFYLGSSTEALLDYKEGDDKGRIRYNRLTDNSSHYWSYLYGSLIIAQLENQWEKAGYSIKYRPEIIATLFNIGFSKSKPKDNPQVGGSTLQIEGDKYFFGSLAFEFYYSGALIDEFPFE